MNAGGLAIGHRRAVLFPWLTALVVLALVLPMMIDQLPRVQSPLSIHAVLQHGEDAVEAKKCADGERQGYLFYNRRSQRWGLACWLGDRWGIVILTAGWLVITAYVTKRLKTLQRMREYMKRQGYEET